MTRNRTKQLLLLGLLLLWPCHALALQQFDDGQVHEITTDGFVPDSEVLDGPGPSVTTLRFPAPYQPQLGYLAIRGSSIVESETDATWHHLVLFDNAFLSTTDGQNALSLAAYGQSMVIQDGGFLGGAEPELHDDSVYLLYDGDFGDEQEPLLLTGRALVQVEGGWLRTALYAQDESRAILNEGIVSYGDTTVWLIRILDQAEVTVTGANLVTDSTGPADDDFDDIVMSEQGVLNVTVQSTNLTQAAVDSLLQFKLIGTLENGTPFNYQIDRGPQTSVNLTIVPEPTTQALWLGLVTLWTLARKRFGSARIRT